MPAFEKLFVRCTKPRGVYWVRYHEKYATLTLILTCPVSLLVRLLSPILESSPQPNVDEVPAAEDEQQNTNQKKPFCFCCLWISDGGTVTYPVSLLHGNSPINILFLQRFALFDLFILIQNVNGDRQDLMYETLLYE